MTKTEIIEKEGLIVIFRGVPLEKMEKTLNALYDGGVRIIEIAFFVLIPPCYCYYITK